jgi:type IV secretory pathway protease TraF
MTGDGMENEAETPEKRGTQSRMQRRRMVIVAASAMGCAAAIRHFLIRAEPARQKPARRKSADSTGNLPDGWRVGGASMAPTLFGPHAELDCPACHIRWAVHWQPGLRPRGDVVCWNCGGLTPIATAALRPGDAVRLVADREPRNFDPGELVAVKLPANAPITAESGADTLAVKRLVAGPGQRIDHRDGWLLVDGIPIGDAFRQTLPPDPNGVNRPDQYGVNRPDQHGVNRPDQHGVNRPDQHGVKRPVTRSWPALITVHDDRHRAANQGSWWEPARAKATRSNDAATLPIAGPASRFRLAASDAPAPWLAYRHRAVHDRLRPDVIRDDFPCNATEVRGLVAVDRLRLSLRLEAIRPGTLQVAFRFGERLSIRELPFAGTGLTGPGGLEDPEPKASPGRQIDIDSESLGEGERPLAGTAAVDLPDGAQLAIRVVAGEAIVSDLVVRRPLAYRIDLRQAARFDWPIRLGDGEYYVLGDNSPLSIDSRHFGAIRGEGLIGRIEPSEPAMSPA